MIIVMPMTSMCAIAPPTSLHRSIRPARVLARRRCIARATSDDRPDSEADAGKEGAEEEGDGISVDDLRVLQQRLESIREKEAKMEVLRLLVLDASVPGQVLPLQFEASSDPTRPLNGGTYVGEDVNLGDRFGMLGQAPINGQILPNGVEVTVTRVLLKPDGSSLVELTAGRRFKVSGQPFEDATNDDAPSGRVVWIDPDSGAGEQTVEGADPAVIHPEAPSPRDPSEYDAESERLCAELPSLVDTWRDLVRVTGRERQPNQLELIEKHLGQMPGVDEPARLACWVAGLINPIPALGVAYEIRPALLMATTVGDMIGVAHKGITLSIKGLKKSSGDVDAE